MKTLVALVGMKHRGSEALVASLPQGEPLVLVREPTNKFDPNAVQVWARGQHVGYVRANQVLPLALAMDSRARGLPITVAAGHFLSATLAIDGGKWPLVELDDEQKKAPPDVG